MVYSRDMSADLVLPLKVRDCLLANEGAAREGNAVQTG